MTSELPLAAPRSHMAPADHAMFDRWQQRRRGDAPRGTKRIAALSEHLGDPHRHLDAIHVVGTDAKTSTTIMIGALLRALGVSTGETISPHLERINERIRINGASVDDAALAKVGRRIDEKLPDIQRSLGESVTFFEMVTAAAFSLFAEHNVMAAVVEAGIGGVGDATSVLAARTVVLTPVGRDHPELGDTYEAVTREKAGVITPGATLVMAGQNAQVRGAAALVAEERGCQVVRAGVDFDVVSRQASTAGQMVEIKGLGAFGARAWLPVHGAHQAANAAVAVAAVQSHLGVDRIDADAVTAGLAAVEIPGRSEIFSSGQTTFVLDGAHDEKSAIALASVVEEMNSAAPIVAVVGSGTGRDAGRVVQHLPCAGAVATCAGARGAAPAEEVAEQLRHLVDEVRCVPDPASAIDVAARLAGPGGVVVVTGSLHLVGAVRGSIASG
ncbi:MAG: Mur ligase family protein [Nitriliruptoraceae bacterium]